MKKVKYLLLVISIFMISLSFIGRVSARGYLDQFGITREKFIKSLQNHLKSKEDGGYLGIQYCGYDQIVGVDPAPSCWNCGKFVLEAFRDAGVNVDRFFGDKTYKGIGVVDWIDFVQDNVITFGTESGVNVEHYHSEHSGTNINYYTSKEDMLANANLKKGDIIILMLNAGDPQYESPACAAEQDTHIGIYWGEYNGITNSFWNSIPTENKIGEIESKNDACPYQWIVLKFADAKVRINKVDSITGNAMPGVTFGLYSDSEATNIIADGTTDVNGNLEFSNVLDGNTYYVKELASTAGYVTNGTIQAVVANTSTTYTKITNQPTMVEIRKTDATTGKEIPGATLKILDKDKKDISCKIKQEDGTLKELSVCSWVSGEKEVTVVGLPVGSYNLQETIAPEGYVLSDTTVAFEVKDDGKTTKIEMKNELEVDVPETASTRSIIALALSMIAIASGIGILIYTKKNKVENE